MKQLQRGRGQEGFTLFEVIIVASLLAMAYVVVAPRLNTIFTTNIEATLGRLQSDFRAAYDMALLHNKYYRLAFDLHTADYWLEVTDAKNVYLGNKSLDSDLTPKELEDAKQNFDQQFELYQDLSAPSRNDPDTQKEIKPETPVLAAKKELLQLKFPQWEIVDNLEWKKRSLAPGLMIIGMRAEHHNSYQSKEALGEGAMAYIYIFPNGYTEKAYIHLGQADFRGNLDDSQKPYTVVVDSYTGVVNIENGQQEVNLEAEN